MISQQLSKFTKIKAALLLLALGCGYFYHGTDNGIFAVSMVSLFSIVGLLLLKTKDAFELPRSMSAGLIFAFFCYTGLSVFWSSSPFLSTLFWFVMMPVSGFALSLILLDRETKLTEIFLKVVIISIAALAIGALFQFYILQIKTRIDFPLKNPNNLAAIFNIGFFLSLTFYYLAKEKSQKYAYLGCALLIFSGIFTTHSRGAFISLAATMTFFIPAVWQGQEKVRTSILPMVLGLVFVYLVMEMGTFKTYDKTSSDILIGTIKPGYLDRISLWTAGLKMFSDNFWLGAGLSTFYFLYPRYRQTSDFSDGYFVHMDPLQFGMEMGILAPLIFYAALIAILWRTNKCLRIKGLEYGAKVKMMGAFCAMLAVLLHTHISFHLYLLAISLPLSICLAFWYMQTEAMLGAARHIVPLEGVAGKVIGSALIVFLVVGAGWSIRTGIGLIYIDAVSLEVTQSKEQLADSKSSLNKADFWLPDSHFAVPQYRGRLGLVEWTINKRSFNKAETKNIYEEIIRNLDEAIERNLYFVTLRFDRGLVHSWAHSQGLSDTAYAEAEDDLIYATQNNTLFLQARYELSSLYQKKGETRKALAVMEDGLKWPRIVGVTDVKFLIATANLRRRIGDIKGYNHLMAEAAARANKYGLRLVK